MNSLKTFWRRLRSLAPWGAAKREIDEELRFHIEQRMAENVAAGMSPEEAARAARKKFGNVQSVREECRETRGADLADAFFQDVRFGWRTLRKNPGFTTVTVLSLALGIGVNIMLFSIFNAIFLRPIPGATAPEGIVSLKRTDRNHNTTGFSYVDYESYRDTNQVFSGMFAWLDRDAGSETLTLGNGAEYRDDAGGGVNAEEIPALLVSDNYFFTLGVRAALGRTFLPEETRTPGSHPVVVLSHRLWQRRFNGEPGVLGKTVTLNGAAFTVIGVVPKDFMGIGDLRATDAWVPLMMMAALDRNRDWEDLKWRWNYQMAGRLKSGVSAREATAELRVLNAQLAEQYHLLPDQRTSLSLQPAGAFAPLGESLGLVLPTMFAVSLVLVIACANVGNLLLARAVARQKEMAIRIAVGASRGRIIRQLLTESGLLALGGGALGLVLGFSFCNAAWSFMQQSLPELQRYIVALDLSPDWHTVGYALVLSLLTALVFGLAPALAAARTNPNTALKNEGALFSQRASGMRLRDFFVVIQMAACLTLLIGVSQLLITSRKASDIQWGFEARDVVLARYDLLRQGHPESRVRTFQDQLLERVKALPGVTRASLAKNTLERNRHVDWVSTGYFETMGIPLLLGRDFAEQDLHGDAAVAIVSQATAKRLWPGEDPIGRRLTNAPFAEIVGVVGNVRNMREVLFFQPSYTPELPGAGQDDFIYLPPSGMNVNSAQMALLVKARETKSVIAAIRDEVRRFDPGVVVSAGPLTQDMQDSLQIFRILGAIADMVGLIALLLAAMGIYGVVSYSVGQRTRELGIRAALGAQRGDILRLVMQRGMGLVAVGLALGLPCAFALSRVLASALIDLRAFDPLTFLVVSLGLGGVMLLACYFPARRATRVEPMVALRYE